MAKMLRFVRTGLRVRLGRYLSALMLCVGAHLTGGAHAFGLLDDFDAAQSHDPTFAVSVAEVDAQRVQAGLARTAFYPEARLSLSQLDSDAGARRTLSVSQPLISVDRWLALKEADPRDASATARLDQSRRDLAMRLVKTVTALIDAKERLQLNGSAIAALEVQATAGRRAFALGQGTITDVRDTEVRLAQARSQAFSLQATLEDAERRYQALVGRRADWRHYTLRAVPAAPGLPPLDALVQRAMAQSPTVLSAEVGLHLAEIAAKRARAAYLPSLNFVAQRSSSGGVSTGSSSIALRMDVPLSASSLMRTGSADLDVRRAREAVRAARQQVTLDVERQYHQVAAASAELPVRREAVRAAELSVLANEQSFIGGVRSKLDVLNALQTKFLSQADHVSALLRLGEALLGLHASSAGDLNDALRTVQTQFFEP